jgi:hypothetical protein
VELEEDHGASEEDVLLEDPELGMTFVELHSHMEHLRYVYFCVSISNKSFEIQIIL